VIVKGTVDQYVPAAQNCKAFSAGGKTFAAA